MKIFKQLKEISGDLGRLVFVITGILAGAFLLRWGSSFLLQSAGPQVLQNYHFDTLLLLAFLIVFLTFTFKQLKSTVLVFFLASLLALILFDKTLLRYAEFLYGQASSPTIFMIILFGGTLALISRTDLIERLKNEEYLIEKQNNDNVPKVILNNLERLQKEVDTFCLLRRFDKWVQRNFQANTTINSIAKFFLTLVPVLANFVSSAVAVLFFKSLWAPGVSDFVSDELNRRRAAGILCLCVSGCLLVFLPCVGVKSVWWIFFDSTVASENLMPQIPVAVLLYAFFSYLHGYILIFGGSQQKTHQNERHSDSCYPLLYLAILAVCIAAVVIISMAVIAGRPPDNTPSPSAQMQSSDIANFNKQSGEPFKIVMVDNINESHPVPKKCKPVKSIGYNKSWFYFSRPALLCQDDPQMPPSLKTKLMVCAVFLGLILAFLIAQILMYRFPFRSANEAWKPASYGELLLKGMRNVFNTVAVLVVILAFKDIIVNTLADIEFPATMSSGFQACFMLIAVIMTIIVGLSIGSSFGTFALGVTVFSIAGITDPTVYRTVIEMLILIATFCNQRSAQADNVQTMLGGNCDKDNVAKVWSVQSFSTSKLGKAQNVQIAFLVFSIAVVALLRYQWPGVF